MINYGDNHVERFGRRVVADCWRKDPATRLRADQVQLRAPIQGMSTTKK